MNRSFNTETDTCTSGAWAAQQIRQQLSAGGNHGHARGIAVCAHIGFQPYRPLREGYLNLLT